MLNKTRLFRHLTPDIFGTFNEKLIALPLKNVIK